MTARHVLAGVVLLGVIAYAGVAIALFAWQRRILFRPDVRQPDVAAVGVPALTAVRLLTADGLDLLAWWLPPASASRPVLLYFHGNGGNLGDRAARLRFAAAAGDGVLMPEYPGYGGNPGAPSEAALFGTVAPALAFLRARRVEDRRVAVYGESLGTGVAADAAAGRQFGAVILESPFTSVTAIARQRYWFLPVDLLVRDKFDTLSRIGRIEAPLLIALGERDDVVPPWMGRALFAAAAEPKELWVASSGGHENLAQSGLLETLERFLGTTIASP
jgi:fermentation-respiration switch protein FrsA (DUF1100 family)